MTFGTAAAAVELAPAEILGRFACVVKIVVPFLFTSQMIGVPVGAVFTAITTLIRFPADGIRNLPTPVWVTRDPACPNTAIPPPPESKMSQLVSTRAPQPVSATAGLYSPRFGVVEPI